MINRCVPCPKNCLVDEINGMMIAKFPENLHRYISYDRTFDKRYLTNYEDFLNSFNPKGLSPHELLLKKKLSYIAFVKCESNGWSLQWHTVNL